MKIIAVTCLPLLLFSCFNTNREKVEIDQLNQRIIRLEQRIDSLTGYRNSNPFEVNNPLCEPGRCQGITRKGTQCKRKAKINNYCWQHNRVEAGGHITTR